MISWTKHYPICVQQFLQLIKGLRPGQLYVKHLSESFELGGQHILVIQCANMPKNFDIYM